MTLRGGEALPSIRQRLSRASLVVSLAWAMAVTSAVWLVVRHELDELMDATLHESAQILHGLLSYNALQLPLQAGQVMPAPPHKEELVWQLVDAEGGVLLRSHQAPTEPMVAVAVRGFADGGSAWRVHAEAFGNQGLVLQVAQPTQERRDAQLEVAQFTAGAALLVGLLCAGWLQWGLRRELAPISELSEAVSHFDPLQATTPLPAAQRQELQPMHQAISDLGSRLARRVASERAFTAHAAHALRTPLAGMVAQLAAAQRVCGDPAVQPMLTLARQAADRLRRVVAALLTLFRTGTEVHWQAINLPALVAQLQVAGLAITTDPSPSLQADPDLLAAALSNLLDNAVRHGATTADISVRPEGNNVCIVVRDNGPGIAAPDRQRLQTMLAAQDYGASAGLGLMLADRVARAHGGVLRLPDVRAGCTVELVLTSGPTTEIGV